MTLKEAFTIITNTHNMLKENSKEDYKKIIRKIRSIVGPGKSTMERGMTNQYFTFSNKEQFLAIKNKMDQTFGTPADTESSFDYTYNGRHIYFPKLHVKRKQYWVGTSYM